MVRSTGLFRSRYGSVEVNDLGMEEGTSSTRAARSLQKHVTYYQWTPPPDLKDDFHPDFSIDLHGYAGPDGMRRFLPSDGIDIFIDRAFLAGLAMMNRDQQLSWERESGYRARKLILERVCRTREHLRRNFNYSRDLFIRQPGRETDSDRTVLPSHTGKTATGAGREWNSMILYDEGRARLRELGIEQPTRSMAISYGLLVAAEQNPLDIDDAEVAPLVRMALFAPSDEDEPLNDECIAEVYGRLTDRLNAHRADDEEGFQRWYNDNLFGSIAGRDMSTGVARKAMLQLGWQAYEYVGQCVSCFIDAFAESRSVSLRTDERESFAHVYQPQPYLGGISMIFLLERQQFLTPIIGRLWNSPGDPQTIRVLHRLFYYYADMAIDRRKADKRSKRRGKQLEIANSDLAESQAVAVEGDRTEQILNRLVEGRGLCCDQCDRRPECAPADRQQLRTDDSWAAVEYWCQEHGNRRQIRIPLSELRAIADELGIQEPD